MFYCCVAHLIHFQTSDLYVRRQGARPQQTPVAPLARPLDGWRKLSSSEQRNSVLNEVDALVTVEYCCRASCSCPSLVFSDDQSSGQEEEGGIEDPPLG